MPELRVDPLTGLRAIVASERAQRPGGGLRAEPAAPIDVERDPFAEGHEDRTPPELYALREDGGERDGPGWSVRVVPNLFPALGGANGGGGGDAAGAGGDAVGGGPAARSRVAGELSGARSSGGPGADPGWGGGAGATPELFFAEPADGAHEVIVNSPDPVSSLAQLPVDQVARAMAAWRERMRAHAGAACRHLIVNERVEAGASLPHTHAQLYALGFVPAAIARERERAGAYATRTVGGDLLGDLVQAEVRDGARIVAIDDEAVLMAPYASRVPYQLMLAPRHARMRFEDDGPLGAALLHDGLRRVARLLGADPPLNLWVRSAPRGAEHFCWRIDVLPRLTHLAGLELGAGLHLNIVAPEHAAAQLREA